MKENYFKSIVKIERLHRLSLDVISFELERLKIRDITNVQCFILYNIGNNNVTVGEIAARGYYLGTNVSYNLKKLIKSGYILESCNLNDLRSTEISLSKKGLALKDKLDTLFTKHSKEFADKGYDKDFDILNDSLSELQEFWTNLLDR